MTIHTQPAAIDSVKKSLVALKMPRALEILDTALRRIEQGEVTWIEALDQLLIEELTLRDNRRVSTALRMSRLTTVKTLAGFDFAFQPSLDRNRILALAELKFIDRAEVVHLLGPPGTGNSHLATALAVEAVKAGKSVAFATLADIVTTLAKAEREGTLRERLRFLARASLLVVDEIGYLPVVPGGGNLFFQLVNARYEKGAMILTSNRGFAEWGCLIACFTTPLLSKSRDRAIGSASTPPSYRKTSARARSQTRRSPSAAAARLEGPMTIPIARLIPEPQSPSPREIWKPILTESSLPVDSADAALADCRQQPLKARPRYPRARATEIIVNDLDGGPTQCLGALSKSILPPATLVVVDHLIRRRLADIDHGATRQMIRRDLGHRRSPRPPPRSQHPCSPLPSVGRAVAVAVSSAHLSVRPLPSTAVRTDLVDSLESFPCPAPSRRGESPSAEPRSESTSARNAIRAPGAKRGCAMSAADRVASACVIQAGKSARVVSG